MPGEGIGRGHDDMRRAYGRFAPFYDVLFGPVLEPGRRAAIRSMGLAPGDRVLEVGVGTGLSLAAYPSHVRVTGIDIAPGMLARAEARVARKRLTHVEGLHAMDASAMGFDAGAFDVVIAMYVVSVVEEPARVVAEMRRVCRPGGRLIIVNHFRTTSRLIRTAEVALRPLHRAIRFRADLELDAFVADNALDVEQTSSANIMGYSTVLCCRNGGGAAGARSDASYRDAAHGE